MPILPKKPTKKHQRIEKFQIIDLISEHDNILLQITRVDDESDEYEELGERLAENMARIESFLDILIALQIAPTRKVLR